MLLIGLAGCTARTPSPPARADSVAAPAVPAPPAAAAGSAAPATAPASVTPEIVAAPGTLSYRAQDVLHAIDSAGPHAVVRSYFVDAPSCGIQMADSIGTGDSLWLVVASRIHAAVDACAGEQTAAAIQEALLASPKLALSVLPPAVSMEDICGMGFDFGRDSVSERYYREALSSLQGLQDPALQSRRDDCLRALMKGHAALTQRPDSEPDP